MKYLYKEDREVILEETIETIFNVLKQTDRDLNFVKHSHRKLIYGEFDVFQNPTYIIEIIERKSFLRKKRKLLFSAQNSSIERKTYLNFSRDLKEGSEIDFIKKEIESYCKEMDLISIWSLVI